MIQNLMKPWLLGYLEVRAPFALSGDRTPGTDSIFMFSKGDAVFAKLKTLAGSIFPVPLLTSEGSITPVPQPLPLRGSHAQFLQTLQAGHGSVSDQSGLFPTQVIIYFSNTACAHGKAIGGKVER